MTPPPRVTGPGILPRTTVTAVGGSTITLSSTAALGSGSGTLSFDQVNGLNKLGPGNLILLGNQVLALSDAGELVVADGDLSEARAGDAVTITGQFTNTSTYSSNPPPNPPAGKLQAGSTITIWFEPVLLACWLISMACRWWVRRIRASRR